MKPERRLMRMTTLGPLMLVFLLAGSACFSGCMVTNKVLDLRKEREMRVKEATNFWSLSAVRSAHVTAGSEVFACVEFRDSPSDAAEAFTVSLSRISQIGKTYADFMPASYSRTEPPRETGAQAAMTWYLYPLLEARKGCGDAPAKSPFPQTALKVETVQMHREDQSRLPGILLSPESYSPNEGRVIEVSFASENHGAKAAPQATNGLVAGPPTTRNVLLVYLPPTPAGEEPRALGLAGAFEPGSEWVNPYSLLVVPAVAADTAIITAIIMLAGLSHR
ncbi:MAG: hypothetical protein ACM3KE_05785 [Hyphomicrobiales bacterium]